MVRKFVKSFLLLSLTTTFITTAVSAQAKRNSRPAANSETIATPAVTPTPERSKKNERPNAVKTNGSADPGTAAVDPSAPFYRYEFSQPDFLVRSVVIKHDDTGKGTIAFKRRSWNEDLVEPIQISAVTLERLNATFVALNFLDSTEDYQFERDFAHMGNVVITLKKNGKERTAKYNWTVNKDAKSLMDEYRRLSNQFVWMFDFNLARENQPLETPRLVDNLDSLLARNEIADPVQLVPFLQAISNDERVPLIGRNHAGKLVKQIEKQKK